MLRTRRAPAGFFGGEEGEGGGGGEQEEMAAQQGTQHSTVGNITENSTSYRSKYDTYEYNTQNLRLRNTNKITVSRFFRVEGDEWLAG